MRARSALLLPLLLVAGCGATESSNVGDFEGEERAVAEAVEELQTAGEGRKAEELCTEHFSRALAQQFRAPGADCEREVTATLVDATDYELEVRDVTVRGDAAEVRVATRTNGQGRLVTMAYVREGGRWKARSLGT